MSHLKLFSWNVNGLRAIEKKGFLDWLAQSGGDVIAVQETKAWPDQLSVAILNPIGYYADWTSAEKKGYSGVGTYSRVAPKTISHGFGDERFDKDGRILISDFERFVFFNIYFPNGGRAPNGCSTNWRFTSALSKWSTTDTQQGRSVIMTGDVNTAYAEIDLARPKKIPRRPVSCRKNARR